MRIILTAFVLVFLSSSLVRAEQLRVDCQALEQMIDLPEGTGNATFHMTKKIYIGNLPDQATEYDVRAPHGRLDGGEIGAYLAALISNKPVTGTASHTQLLLLLHAAAKGGGKSGKEGARIKAIRQQILDNIARDGRKRMWF